MSFIQIGRHVYVYEKELILSTLQVRNIIFI